MRRITLDGWLLPVAYHKAHRKEVDISGTPRRPAAVAAKPTGDSPTSLPSTAGAEVVSLAPGAVARAPDDRMKARSLLRQDSPPRFRTVRTRSAHRVGALLASTFALVFALWAIGTWRQRWSEKEGSGLGYRASP